jgi:uncharacterized LabA/DUF88 family protein
LAVARRQRIAIAPVTRCSRTCHRSISITFSSTHDGANFFATVRALGFDIDYRALLREFSTRGELLRAYYYTIEMEDDQQHVPLRPLLDFLEYNGFTVVTKWGREYVDEATGRRRVKGSLHIKLATDALDIAPHVHQLVLFSGDGDFVPLVEAVQRRGVSVVSTTATRVPMIAEDLRRQADAFIDLRDLQPQITRPPRERDALPAFVARPAGNGAEASP